MNEVQQRWGVDVRTAAEVARAIEATLVGEPDLELEGLCGLSDNLPARLSFIGKPAQRRLAETSAIPAFITRPDHAPAGKTCLLHPDPDYAIARAAALFERGRLSYADSGSRHPTAVIHPDASLGPGCEIGAHVVIGKGVRLGARCRLYPGAVVMDRAILGDDCLLNPNTVVREDCVLGNRVVLQPGAVIGGDGFGFIEREGRHQKIPQLGSVILEDDVEVGANATIDRGRFTATRVGKGSKIDNLVMIAHNVKVGENCLIVAQTGISGSTQLGDRVVLAGQVGVTGHLRICSDVTVMGKSVIAKHVLKPGVYAGIPTRPIALWKKAVARLYAGLRSDGTGAPDDETEA